MKLIEWLLICASIPSIEFWFIIYYMNTSGYFKESDAVSKVLPIGRFTHSLSYFHNA